MARQTIKAADVASALISEAKSGTFAPVYLLMGEEAYYPELVCRTILEECIPEDEKDFNETVCFGADVSAEQVITASRRFPMMAERQLVVVKEAQLMDSLEDLSIYCCNPMDSTVLVILMRNASADKRKALYKAVSKTGKVLESQTLRDYEMPRWIEEYFRSRGLKIEPEAARLFAESAGTTLSAIVTETDKLLENLPEGIVSVSVADVEKNIGLSRQFSVFELTKELSFKNAGKALKIASRLGSGARFKMPAAVSVLFLHFDRILKYDALLSRKKPISPEDKAKALAGVNPYFYGEYETASRNYPLDSAMKAISLLCEFDYLGKGGDGDNAENGELLMELTAKLLNL